MISAAEQARAGSRSNGERGTAARVLTVVPICDGHDSAIMTVNFELARHGVEVVYLGYDRPVSDIVRAAIQEDVRGVGISSYNGGHVEFFSEVLSRLRQNGAGDIGVFGGGGGTITPHDARLMTRRGVDRIFLPGDRLTEMAEWVGQHYRRRRVRPRQQGTGASASRDLALARQLTAVEAGHRPPARNGAGTTPVVGVTGPGGAGKTTLIDELVLRFLRSRPDGRLAILSHDPAAAGQGALLGDRASMVYAQDDRVFMRSLAAAGNHGGLAPATRGCLAVLRHAGFDLVLVESAGIGQESAPFAAGLVDKQVLVMSPGYGGRLQLQKTFMLGVADIVVVNKADLPGARTAVAEIEERLGMNRRGQKLLSTIARVHADPGVDRLFQEVCA